MEQKKAKSPYNAGRRIRRLGIAVIVVAIAYSFGWHWLAGEVDRRAARLVEAQRGLGTAIECADRDVRGYPFRLEIHCASIDVNRPAEGLMIAAAGFRSAAQVYEPRRVYAELDAPVTVESAFAGAAVLDWTLARATASLAAPLPQRGSVVIDDLEIAVAGLEKAMAAAHAEAHMRTAGDDLDLALRYEGLVLDDRLLGGRRLPALAGDADVAVRDGVALATQGMSTMRGVSGEIRRLALLLTPQRGVLASGPFEVGPDGLIDAKLDLIVVDPAGLAADLKPVFPEYAGQIDLLSAVPEQPGPDSTPEIRFPLTVRDGRVTLGFIPVGQLPPLR